MLHIALHEPEIPPNTGNIIRLCANTGATLHIIEPTGFAWDDKRLRRAGLDYHEFAAVRFHPGFAEFLSAIAGQRLFALSTKASQNYSDMQFRAGDCFMFGSESRGLPEAIRSHASVHARLRIPMLPESRSLNLSNSAAIVLFEAWRQLDFCTPDI